MGNNYINAFKNNVTIIGSSISNVTKKIKTTVDKKIDEYNNKKEQIYNNKIRNIDDPMIQYFIQMLRPNCIYTNSNRIKIIRRYFPIPNTDYLFWTSLSGDKKKIVIIVTDKGIYIKYKEEKKYMLYIYSWEMFEPKLFLNYETCEPLYKLGLDLYKHFLECCKEISDNEIVYELHNNKLVAKFKPKTNLFIYESLVVSSGVVNSDKATFAAKNSAANTTGGHGLFAEEANNIIDKMLFNDAKILGRDNAKFGPDRMVEGQYIQSKYWNTAGSSVGAAFDSSNNGMYKYVMDDGTVMQLEVPKDQYEQALKKFAQKIKEGKVPGVTDPADANKYVRKGHITYEQALKIAKAGTIESITYDILTGSITCTFAFGISFLVTFFFTFRRTKDLKSSLVEGLKTGSYVFGISLFEHVTLSQLARTALFKDILKSTFKGGVFVSTLTFALFSIKDIYGICKKKISTSQFYLNLSSLAGSIIGSFTLGLVGAKVGASIGSKGGYVGGIIGGVTGGIGGGIGVSAFNKIFIEDDVTIFLRLFNAYITLLAYEYFFNEDEIDELLNKLNKVNEKEIKKMIVNYISSNDQNKTIRIFLEPYYDEIISTRQKLDLKTT